MSIIRSLLAAGALTLAGATSAFVTPGHAALHPNAINLNSLTQNSLTFNALGGGLAPAAQAAGDVWQLSPRGITLPSGRSFELPR